jgi:hypothetical protein
MLDDEQHLVVVDRAAVRMLGIEQLAELEVSLVAELAFGSAVVRLRLNLRLAAAFARIGCHIGISAEARTVTYSALDVNPRASEQ